MKTVKFMIAVAGFALTLASMTAATEAATAHNSQTGAGTANVYDSAADAQTKQAR